MFLSTLLISVLLTVTAIPILSRLALRYQLVDIPNERKVHTHPIPRVGGVAMVFGTLAPVAYWIQDDLFVTSYLAGAGALLLFCILDDLRELSPGWKLLGQLIAAIIVIFVGGIKFTKMGMLAPEGFLLPDVAAVPLTVLVIVGVTNAINLADGLDGLAGGISLLSLALIGYLAYQEGDFTIGLIALALCGAIFGFLRFNTYPATVFMGDTGSQLLGFSTIVLALQLTQQGTTALSPLLPLLILGFPVLDTLTVMTSRIARGCSPFAPDKTHFHHSLLRLGLRQSESVLVIYLIQVALLMAAYQFRFYSDWLLLGIYLAFSCSVLTLFSRTHIDTWQPRRLALLLTLKELRRRLQYQTCSVKQLFRTLKFGAGGLLLLTVSLVGKVPPYFAWSALASLVVVSVVAFLAPKRVEETLKAVLYLLIPLLVFRSDAALRETSTMAILRLYNSAFWLLAILNVLVSKMTRRTTGFKSTPLDFLILVIALVTPNLPESGFENNHLGIIAAKIIIAYFTCEVLFAELRGNIRFALKGVVAALLVVVLQGMR